MGERVLNSPLSGKGPKGESSIEMGRSSEVSISPALATPPSHLHAFEPDSLTQQPKALEIPGDQHSLFFRNWSESVWSGCQNIPFLAPGHEQAHTATADPLHSSPSSRHLTIYCFRFLHRFYSQAAPPAASCLNVLVPLLWPLSSHLRILHFMCSSLVLYLPARQLLLQSLVNSFSVVLGIPAFPRLWLFLAIRSAAGRRVTSGRSPRTCPHGDVPRVPQHG